MKKKKWVSLAFTMIGGIINVSVLMGLCTDLKSCLVAIITGFMWMSLGAWVLQGDLWK